ncbi:MAG: hypothetical protein ABF335_03135 [Alphaproteobacteria bacterium]
MSTTPELHRIQIFRAGTHRSMTGEAMPFSAADVAELAATYDPALHEAPLIIGHPVKGTTAMPAYGWIKGLEAEGDTLFAAVDQVPDEMREAVNNGHYKKVSSGLLRPDSPANPTPGKWHLEHVALLGATPPAIKGLEPFQFSAGDGDVVCFSNEREWRQLRLAELFRSVVRVVRGTLAEEDAAALPSDDQLDWMRDEFAEELIEERAKNPSIPAHFAAATQQPTEETTIMAEKTEQELKADRDALDAAQKAHEDRVAAFAAQQQATEQAADKVAVEAAIKDGRLAAGQKDEVLAFAATLEPDADTVCFAAQSVGGDSVKVAPRTWFRQHIASLPKRAPEGEAAPDGPDVGTTAQFAAPSGFEVSPAGVDIHQKALAYQAKFPKATYADAVAAVS